MAHSHPHAAPPKKADDRLRINANYYALAVGDIVTLETSIPYLSNEWTVNAHTPFELSPPQLDRGILLQDVDGDTEWLVLAHDTNGVRRLFHLTCPSDDDGMAHGPTSMYEYDASRTRVRLDAGVGGSRDRE